MGWLARHWKKIASLVVVTGIVFALFGQTIVRNLRMLAVTPSGSFEEYTQPDAPDYRGSGFLDRPSRYSG